MDSSAVLHSQRPSMCDDRVAVRGWGDLPNELLPAIAERLGLIDLLCFRGVCKDWNSASSAASAEIEALTDLEPWFLVYGENNSSRCTLVTGSGERYSITIPEMEGATCLASSQGWLLLFRQGSLFFFCPFSRTTIELPVPCQLAHGESSDHVAVLSAPPTSDDCDVCIICRIERRQDLELYVIHRGANSWTNHKLYSFPSRIECAAYHDGVF
ncbi:F-box protein At4g12382-like [Hibiscus syriacus]|uniref:F-box protein At4g12382-like n=1 Tax=Hibiscus syriacus TaxID=106335 RepID=UPI0019217404|nr:F-box protein At4g12382-like [Hibiscus syriacus]